MPTGQVALWYLAIAAHSKHLASKGAPNNFPSAFIVGISGCTVTTTSPRCIFVFKPVTYF